MDRDHNTAADAGRKTNRAAGSVLLASLLAVCGALQAQSLTGSWRSHLSADAPDVIYRTYCAVCHGDKGDGKGIAKDAFDPPPENFTSEETRKELSRAHMIETLNKGAFTKKGKRTAMIAWKDHLSREQIEAVVDYVIVNFMDGKVVPDDQLHAEGLEHKGHNHSMANIKGVDYPYGLKANVSRGKSLYSANCAMCHGDQGDGRSPSAPKGTILPRSFHDAGFRSFANGFTLFSLLAQNKGHLPAGDKSLGNQDIADVSEYVLQTFVRQHHAESVKK